MRQFLDVVESPTETAMFDSLRSQGRLKVQFVVAARSGTVKLPLAITGMKASYDRDGRWHLESCIWRSDASKELVELVDLTLPELPEDWRMVYVSGDFTQDGGDQNFLELRESRM